MAWFSCWLLVVHFWMIFTRISSLQVKAVAGKYNMALYGHSFLNSTDVNMDDCVAKCLDNCLCLSLQLCDGKCQLCDSNRHENPGAYREKKGCMNFEITSSRDGCFAASKTDINCCLKSNPCWNGGKCEPIIRSPLRRRFRCKCPRGYGGERCKHVMKSCRHAPRVTGNYYISDYNNNTLQVFCDFNNDTRTVWTLVQSYELSESRYFRDKPYYKDMPYNELSPSWKKYRLSYDQMKSVMSDSTKWRVTCDYDKDGVVYTDYITGSNTAVDILNFQGYRCFHVNYVNVRGHSCKDCSVFLIQHNNFILHTDSYYHAHSCNFKISRDSGTYICGIAGEDNFGLYRCINPLHRCSSNLESTTQTWFGHEL